MIKFFRKYHKWLGVIFAYNILSFVFSGIILNHREALSFIDVNRKLLPKEYRYQELEQCSSQIDLKNLFRQHTGLRKYRYLAY